MANMARSKGQVYSVGNYLMTGKVLGKGHFARVEEATHRIIGKKVAIKVIDLTCIKEEYARRNLHREPRVMARLRHPCIAALYETMMHGPRLYVVMEAAGGGDLCAHVVAARGGGGARGGAGRGLPEARARSLAAQLVSAVRHMHARGVVHRDLKMENIMLDSTKQFIKIVDFGLSNVWTAGGALRTQCGSLEYAAPELFVDGRRYGPEVDLWSIGVIVYGMVTGGLPFGAEGAEGAEGRSRPLLRAAITRGFSRKQHSALAFVSNECKTFIQHLLEPRVELRMKIEEAARHRWLKRPGMRMKTHPFGNLDPKLNKELYKQISELCGQTIMDVVAQIKADPFGAMAGIYNIKTHLFQLQVPPGSDLLWSSNTQEPRSVSPPEYRPRHEFDPEMLHTDRPRLVTPEKQSLSNMNKSRPRNDLSNPGDVKTSGQKVNGLTRSTSMNTVDRLAQLQSQQTQVEAKSQIMSDRSQIARSKILQNCSINKPTASGLKKPVFRVFESGDCGTNQTRLPSIHEHSNTDLNEARRNLRRTGRPPCVRKASLEEPLRLNSCPGKGVDAKRSEFYRRAGDGLPSWRASGVPTPPTRILLQSNATTIKRASLGNIISPHSSSNSHCKSERAMPVGWYSTRSALGSEAAHLHRLRRTAPMK